VEVEDGLLGPVAGTVDDFVVRRGDGVPAYNLAVVVDDAAQGVDQVVRGADLADSTPRQAWLGRTLGLPEPSYAHVPLVLGPDGARLAKRHGAVTLREQAAPVIPLLARTLGLALADEHVTATDLLDRFDPARLPAAPTVFSPD
jgi:glutamyl-tRNA synthetase